MFKLDMLRYRQLVNDRLRIQLIGINVALRSVSCQILFIALLNLSLFDRFENSFKRAGSRNVNKLL